MMGFGRYLFVAGIQNDCRSVKTEVSLRFEGTD
jgi:hypothetical protein